MSETWLIATDRNDCNQWFSFLWLFFPDDCMPYACAQGRTKFGWRRPAILYTWLDTCMVQRLLHDSRHSLNFPKTCNRAQGSRGFAKSPLHVFQNFGRIRQGNPHSFENVQPALHKKIKSDASAGRPYARGKHNTTTFFKHLYKFRKNIISLLPQI